MIINVLHLPHRTDRLIHLTEQMQSQRANFVLHDGIQNIKPHVGISAAHRQIIRIAQAKKEPMCCVCEDDIEFSDPNAYKYFIEHLPDNFSMYMGCIYHGEIRPDNTVRDFSSLTLYIVHEKFYDTFLSVPGDIHLDRGLRGLGKFVVCNPFVCKQIDGYSDNARKMTDYNRQHMGQRKFYHSS